MGLELAKEAYIRGADLKLVVANVSVDIPSVFDVVRVETSSEMNDAVLSLIPDYKAKSEWQKPLASDCRKTRSDVLKIVLYKAN